MATTTIRPRHTAIALIDNGNGMDGRGAGWQRSDREQWKQSVGAGDPKKLDMPTTPITIHFYGKISLPLAINPHGDESAW